MFRIALLLLSVLFGSATALAHPVGPGAEYVVQLEDELGRMLPTFHHGGRTYLLGRYGQRYNIRVRNQTDRRVEAVVTVDGRDVVSGRAGDYTRERGYVLGPYGQVLIEGFRTSEREVAAFRFTDPADSYSARMGTPQHVGVIGVALFREHSRPRPLAQRDGRWPARKSRARKGAPGPAAEAEGMAPPERARRKAGMARRMAPADDQEVLSGLTRSRRSNLGTQYGEERSSHVSTTRFRRHDRATPDRVIVLHYDDEQGLLARGIRVYPAHHAGVDPQPFPHNRFAPPPPH
ncbi:MAG: hypothetical protein OXR73_24490 [Myxococcales bacterium]|nr:hypothetical protein [Myxococcales bacterium]